MKFLKVINTLAMCTTTFEAVSTLYNANNADNDIRRLQQLETFGRTCKSQNKWELNPQCLEEAWFLDALVGFYDNHGMEVNLWTDGTPGNPP